MSAITFLMLSAILTKLEGGSCVYRLIIISLLQAPSPHGFITYFGHRNGHTIEIKEETNEPSSIYVTWTQQWRTS